MTIKSQEKVGFFLLPYSGRFFFPMSIPLFQEKRTPVTGGQKSISDNMSRLNHKRARMSLVTLDTPRLPGKCRFYMKLGIASWTQTPDTAPIASGVAD